MSRKRPFDTDDAVGAVGFADRTNYLQWLPGELIEYIAAWDDAAVIIPAALHARPIERHRRALCAQLHEHVAHTFAQHEWSLPFRAQLCATHNCNGELEWYEESFAYDEFREWMETNWRFDLVIFPLLETPIAKYPRLKRAALIRIAAIDPNSYLQYREVNALILQTLICYASDPCVVLAALQNVGDRTVTLDTLLLDMLIPEESDAWQPQMMALVIEHRTRISLGRAHFLTRFFAKLIAPLAGLNEMYLKVQTTKFSIPNVMLDEVVLRAAIFRAPVDECICWLRLAVERANQEHKRAAPDVIRALSAALDMAEQRKRAHELTHQVRAAFEKDKKDAEARAFTRAQEDAEARAQERARSRARERAAEMKS